jgi:hypothetical protein
VIGSETAGGHHTVYMRMMLELLASRCGGR